MGQGLGSKKALITGARGAVGSVLTTHLEHKGLEVIPWNRNAVPLDNPGASEEFLRSERPDLLFHLAIGSKSTGKPNESWSVNVGWTCALAELAGKLGIKFVYTSTVMVFSDAAKGPFTLHSVPEAKEGYGYEKRISEERVMSLNPEARIVRLGWQIGEKPGSNNMIDFFDRKMREEGKVSASRKWLPACSFLEDTADALRRVSDMRAGLYLLDSNLKWNFFEIASALNDLHGGNWKIEPSEDFIYDQRLQDGRVTMPPLNHRLKDLC